MQGVRKFIGMNKNIMIVNHVNGIIRLNRWIHETIGSNCESSMKLECGKQAQLLHSVSDSWTLCEEDYSPFWWLWVERPGIFVHQVRDPFSIYVLAKKDIEVHIYCGDDPRNTEALPVNYAAAWERLTANIVEQAELELEVELEHDTKMTPQHKNMTLL